MMDALRMRTVTELHLRDPVRDVCALHNGTMFAAAQRKYVYIYDSSGAEIHCMKQHLEPRRLEFLPYHFLLSSVGNAGYLKYHDVSIGTLVAEHRTKLGACDCMTQNPQNAVVHLGHANGVVREKIMPCQYLISLAVRPMRTSIAAGLDELGNTLRESVGCRSQCGVLQ